MMILKKVKQMNKTEKNIYIILLFHMKKILNSFFDKF